MSTTVCDGCFIHLLQISPIREGGVYHFFRRDTPIACYADTHMMKPDTLHVYCKRNGVTDRRILEYETRADINEFGMLSMSEADKMTLLLSSALISSGASVVCIFLANFDEKTHRPSTSMHIHPSASEAWALQIPYNSCNAILEQLTPSVQRICFHYIECMEQSIIATCVAPNACWLVDHDKDVPLPNMSAIERTTFDIIFAMLAAKGTSPRPQDVES